MLYPYSYLIFQISYQFSAHACNSYPIGWDRNDRGNDTPFSQIEYARFGRIDEKQSIM